MQSKLQEQVQIPTQNHQQWSEQGKVQISNQNTMIIGDYIAVVFPEFQAQWLVQAIGNATFQSMVDLICHEAIILKHRYIFIQLGGNQI